ncbi:unnamed protein product [Tilletia controversa]|uniref:Glucose-methanol-choline oxidoreductase N-terminal domain-containing protein n=1 Tax=Tilletia caries TaxID=13290 RepID=A0A177VD00_9BASI|nr:hypothetical protein CF336_g7005 [Tilletia laevis]KAE8249118.1 hypothetical protein A4X03_0g6662 [Tilletia caries]CAD6917793.1 unnamed protein product [Tilletia controversa]KAE8190378.1 hypothetical protein CF335_g6372 [Tilletia laevis]CAD6899622.1 unnamed protein product [Tilletia caries]
MFKALHVATVASTIAFAAAHINFTGATPVPWNAQLGSPRAELAERIIPSLSLNISWGKSSESYDYIVIGGGTAGLAVAARLSEDPFCSVAVIEAGDSGFNVDIIDTPGLFGADLMTSYDYKFFTQPGPNTPAKYWPRGKVLGGSSALNFLVWDRAAKQEYNAWEELGNKGWNWSNMYKYMRKSEEFSAPTQAQQDKLHLHPVSSDYGSSGPIKVSYPKYVSEQVQNWIPALQSLGLTYNNQPLAGDNVGASLQPADINPTNSTRSYSAVAYYLPNSARPNLKVYLNSTVTKINFESSKDLFGNVKASSVSFQTGDKTRSLPVKKEVIVSGGVVNSPQILELSGIGNPSILKAAGIKTVVDLPGVGENLQDHTYTCAAFELKDGHVTLDSLRNDPQFAAQQKELYKQNSDSNPSIYTETVPAIAYISLETLVGSDKAKSMTSAAASYVDGSKTPYNATLKKQVEFLQKYPDAISQMELIGIDGYFASTGAPEAGKNYVTFLAAQQHAFARGNIHVNTSSPLSAPVIVPRYFENEYDINISVAGTEYLRKIANTTEYASYIAKEVVPGAQSDMAQFVRDSASTEYHGLGTCSMLPRNQGGVVNNKLVVYGTSNVRVADASIIPLHVSAHIQATIYGVAEFAADIIRGRALFM